jgi:hypothetical protein
MQATAAVARSKIRIEPSSIVATGERRAGVRPRNAPSPGRIAYSPGANDRAQPKRDHAFKLARFIRRSLGCDSKDGDEAVGFA